MTRYEMEGLCDILVSTHERARCVMLGIRGAAKTEWDADALANTLHTVVDEISDAVSNLRSHLKELHS